MGHLYSVGGLTPAGVFSHHLAEANTAMRTSNHFAIIPKLLTEAGACGTISRNIQGNAHVARTSNGKEMLLMSTLKEKRLILE